MRRNSALTLKHVLLLVTIPIKFCPRTSPCSAVNRADRGALFKFRGALWTSDAFMEIWCGVYFTSDKFCLKFAQDRFLVKITIDNLFVTLVLHAEAYQCSVLQVCRGTFDSDLALLICNTSSELHVTLVLYADAYK